MDFESEFYRFFWLVPLPFLLAYILVESGVRLKKGWKRAVLLLAVGGLVLFWNRASLRQLATVSIPKQGRSLRHLLPVRGNGVWNR